MESSIIQNLKLLNMKKKPIKNESEQEGKEKVYGDPIYPATEDIYSQDQKELFSEELAPEIGTGKAGISKSEENLDEGLDVPGAELDDADEAIGEEDEENNYYSLGGDNHSNLDEDKGE